MAGRYSASLGTTRYLIWASCTPAYQATTACDGETIPTHRTRRKSQPVRVETVDPGDSRIPAKFEAAASERFGDHSDIAAGGAALLFFRLRFVDGIQEPTHRDQHGQKVDGEGIRVAGGLWRVEELE